MPDITLQTVGALKVFFKLDWNTWMPLSFNSIQYGPANLPPPSWTLSQQYSTSIYPNGVPSFGTIVSGNYQSGNYPYGYSVPLGINDMSSNSVVSGKTYAFAVDLMNYWVQLYFIVSGSSVGSTVLPGFGLCNLSTNPNAWTYITPKEFTGEWQIRLLTGYSSVPVLLKVEYAPLRQFTFGDNDHGSASLIFTCSGGYGYASFPPSPPTLDGKASIVLIEPRHTDMQYIDERSDVYDFRRQNGELINEPQ